MLGSTIVQNSDGTASLVHPIYGPVHSVGGPNAAALLQQAYPSATVSGAAAPAASGAAPAPTRNDVVRAYESILGRRPESEEAINFYTNPANLSTGAGLTGIPALQALLADSPEGRAKAAADAAAAGRGTTTPTPTTDRRADLTALYNRIFGRAPDEAGLNYYLTGGGKDLPIPEVERLFKASPELNPTGKFGLPDANPVAARRTGLTELYKTVLGRDPDAPGLDYYLSGAGKDVPLSRVSELLRDSPEFRERFPKFDTAQKQFEFPTQPRPQEILGITGRPTTPRGIADLYQRFLGREPDPTGLQFYTQKFGPTMTPQGVGEFIGDIYGPAGEIARRGGTVPELAYRGLVTPPNAPTLTYGSQEVSPFGFVAPETTTAPVGGQAGGLVAYKEGGMPKLSAKEAGSKFDASKFLDEEGRLVGGFLRPESRPDRRVPDEYGTYGRPIQDEFGGITNYEFVPYQSNVVFNPALREAEARGMSPEEREAALREMLVRQGLTGISPTRGGLPGIIPREPIMRERPQYYSYAEGGLAGLGQNLASQGRYGDTMLVHMSPEEVQGLRGLAMQVGGDLTINPQTGLPEAFKLKKLFRAILPMLPFLIPGVGAAIAGFGKSAFGLSALASKSIAAGLIGGFTAPGKGFNFKAGLRTGIMAFAGGKLAEGFQAAGQSGVSTGPTGGTTAPNMPRPITADQIMANNPNMFPADATQAASNLNTATQTAMGAPATVPSGLPTTPASPGFLPPDAALETNIADLGRPAPPIPTETGAQLPPAEIAAASQAPAGTPSLTTTPTVQGVKEAGTGVQKILSGSPEASAAFTQAVGVKPSTAFTIGTTAAAALAPDPEEEERRRLEEEQRQRQKVFDALYARTLGRIPMGAGGGIVALAGGGMPTFEYGGTTAPTGEPRMVQGAGDGMSDNVPANIEGVQEARLANDEFVVPADVVADIGNGSSNAGAKKLYAMMDRIRKARHGTTEQPPEIDAERLMPA